MFLNSRYANGEVLMGEHHDKVVYLATRRFPGVSDYLLYRWKAGDRIDIVASGLGLPRLEWYQIMDANPDIPSPTMIKPGSVIRIPRS